MLLNHLDAFACHNFLPYLPFEERACADIAFEDRWCAGYPTGGGKVVGIIGGKIAFDGSLCYQFIFNARKKRFKKLLSSHEHNMHMFSLRHTCTGKRFFWIGIALNKRHALKIIG